MTGTGEHGIGFKRHLRPEIVAGEAVYLISETGVTALQGQCVEPIAALLDGTRDLASVLRDLPADLCPERVTRVLTRLRVAGLIGDHGPDEAPAERSTLAYWDAAGLDPLNAVSATSSAAVGVIALDGLSADLLAEPLSRAGLRVTDSASADLSVVLCTDYLSPDLAVVDEAQRLSGTPWLLVKPVGTRMWVGPLFTPGSGPCWHCLASPLTANHAAEAHVRARRGQHWNATAPEVVLAPVAATALDVAAAEAAKWLAGYRHAGQHEVFVYDSLTQHVEHHVVRRRPQCGECGDPDAQRGLAWNPVPLRSRTKRSRRGGGHRSASPREVLDRYRHLVSPLTGVVPDITRDERGPDFFQSFRSGVNIAAGDTLDDLRSALRCANGGKGVTPLDAEVGALCEAVERYSGTFHGDEERLRASYADLGDTAVHPDTCLLFHPRQFEERERWNPRHSPFQHVPEPFDDHEAVDWTPVWSMTAQQHRLVPTGMLYFGAPAPGSLCADSNGCAAGSSVEDAVLQGLLEVVERDAVALWWYNRSRVPAIDLDALRDHWIDELREVYAELDREVWLLDITSDLGVPVAVAVSRRTTGPREEIVFGFGAHLDPHVAARRALTELNQVMPAMVGPDVLDSPHLDLDLRRWLRDASAADQPYLLPSGGAAPTHEYTHRTDLRDDVHAIRDAVHAAGLEVLVLDQTRPDVGLPVVKVLVPGMRHFWSRLAQGRLYDVPVQLGRASTSTAYEELNPIPMFM